MKALDYVVIILAGSILLTASKGAAEYNDITARLTSGGHILMVRHALAPGSGDPKDFEIGDCSTQRNLNETGRAQARRIGDWLRNNGIVSARIYSSQWCRCIETAKLMSVGSVRELPALNSFYERIQDRDTNIKALKNFISRQPVDGGLIVLVTHFVTITAMTGVSVSSGAGVLVELQEDSSYEVVGKIAFEN